MIAPVFAAYMICAPVQVHNSTQTWTTQDTANMRAIRDHGCREKYPTMPCLRTFDKIGVEEYNAVCGPPKPLKED